MENSFCSAAPVVLKFAKVLLVQLYFLKVFPQVTVFFALLDNSLDVISCLFVDSSIYIEMA